MDILVTGANGQLGSEIKKLTKNSDIYNFVFVDKEQINITSVDQIERYFTQFSFAYCVNCAAYTAVDKSEEDYNTAYSVNVNGAENLALVCKKFNTTLIHISTDFVFDGKSNTAYSENDYPDPQNIYGITKLKGEKKIREIIKKHFILRTSWLYSSYGNNFVKTMLRLGTERDLVNVVDDQYGTPTYAGDLALIILKIIKNQSTAYGLYHYSNEGIASWYDFAQRIFKFSNINIKIKPISTNQFPLPAKRPVFTVLKKDKIKKAFNIEIPHWNLSLEKCLQIINNH